MRNAQKQSYLQGAVILTVSTMLVKLIGMVYKIPLVNILGAGGMSSFNAAYSIFNPIYALSVAGFPVAVSKMVSESMAHNRVREVRRILRVSAALFCGAGMVGSLLMLQGAGLFARMIGNPAAAPAIRYMAPAIFFCCIISSWRGYYQGLHNMMPTAVSQVVESLARLGFGIALSLWMIRRGLLEYAATGTVYGAVCTTEQQAQLLVLPWGAAGAVLGVSLSTVAGALYLGLYHLLHAPKLSEGALSAPPRSRLSIGRRLSSIALPVCLSAAVSHVSNLVDLVTIMNRIGVALSRDMEAVAAQYAGILPEGLPVEELPSWLYGAMSCTSSLFNLVPALTVALGISALPSISSGWSLKNRALVQEQVRSVIKLSALIAIPAGLGMSALAQPILMLLFPARPAEVAVAAPLLRSIGVCAVLTGITTPMMSTFQAMGMAGIPVRLMLVGALCKTAVNYVLLAVPRINIQGAPMGTIVCYGVILLAGLCLLQRKAGIRIQTGKTLLRPLICGIFCALAANTSYGLLSRLSDSRLVVLFSIAFGGVIYGVFILFLKIITKNEVLMLPGGKKIAKILEKLSFLG